MLELFQFSFAVRALEAGLLIGLIAPLIGIFIVLRRFSLIADTLSHVSFAGVAFGLLLGINPILTAIVASVLASLGIERLRGNKHTYGDSALSLFLSGSLALAIVLLGFTNGSGINATNYLFGSIVTVTKEDLVLIAGAAGGVILLVAAFYKELIYISFDEEGARVSGLPVPFLNFLLVATAALTIALAMPIVGILLISALMVIPVLAALQYKQGFGRTLLIAECISLFSVLAGIIISFYLGISTGGTIVLVALFCFIFSLIIKKT